MRILTSFQLYLEALKDEIPKIQQKRVKNVWGEKFLDYDIPKKTDLIEEGRWELTKGEKFKILDNFFNTNIEYLEKELKTLTPEFGQALYESISNKKVKLIWKDFNINELTFKQIASLYDNNFKLLNPKETDAKKMVLKDKYGKPILDAENKLQFAEKIAGDLIFTNNISNINGFIEAWNRTKKGKIEIDFNNSYFTAIKSTLVDNPNIVDFNIFENSPIFLYITAKPTDVLNMSVSQFYSSCQNLYNNDNIDGHMGKLLSNVFDINSKIAYIILDTPYYSAEQKGQKVSDIMPISRLIIRKLKSNKLYFDRAYPERMYDLMYELITKYTYNRHSDKSEYSSELDVDMDDHIPSPYQDNLRDDSVKIVGKNMKEIEFFNLFSYSIKDNIIKKKTQLDIKPTNNVKKIKIGLTEELYNNISKFEVELLKLVDDIFPKCNYIQYENFQLQNISVDFNKLVFKNTLSISDVEFINNDPIANLDKNITYLELNKITFTEYKNKTMPDLSEFRNLEELRMEYSYKEINRSILQLSNLKKLIISRNMELNNIEILTELKKRGVKIGFVGI